MAITIAAMLCCMPLKGSAQCSDSLYVVTLPQVKNDTCKGEANGSFFIRINPISASSTAYMVSVNGGPPESAMPSLNIPGTFEAAFDQLAAGIYEVVVEDNNMCSDTLLATVREPASPFTILIDSARDALCGSNGYLSVITSGGWSNPTVFTWTGYDDNLNLLPGYPRTQGFQLRNLGGGVYTVSATDFGGCKATASASLIGLDAFSIVMNPGTDQSIDIGSSIVLSASTTSGSNIEYTWFPLTGLTPLTANSDSVLATPCKKTTYIALAIDEARGCASADSVTVSMAEAFEPFVPNIFNPKSLDPKNNAFQAFGIGLTDVEMQIFDRRGNLVYEQADTSLARWNGNWWGDGEEAATGRYLYILRMRSVCNDVLRRTGSVTLIR